MRHSLPSPGFTSLATQWTVQPLAILAVVLAGGWYILSVRRLAMAGTTRGGWPVRRSVLFGAGLALLVWTTCAFPQAYASSLYWVWTAQTLSLFLLVPFVLLSGQPLQLARAHSGRDGVVDRLLRSRAGRLLSNPLVGPALVPLLSGLLFFGPLPGWAVAAPLFGWALQLVLVAVGGLILLPLIGLDDEPSSLAVGLTLAIGSFELVLDAIPGIALRMHTSLVTSYFDYRSAHSWAPSALHDQQIAGSILWCVSELIDLPFLLIVFRRWLRADARDAAAVDAVLEAERIARSGVDESGEAASRSDVPWWLTDPTMRNRLRRGR
ncbi:MAG: cytochrome c oxidase assembly protein [Jatrophihabitantaceae bacterium]